MNNFLAFLAALNWQFVILCLVLLMGFGGFYIISSINRANRREEKRKLEQLRVDSARNIVPVQSRSEY